MSLQEEQNNRQYWADKDLLISHCAFFEIIIPRFSKELRKSWKTLLGITDTSIDIPILCSADKSSLANSHVSLGVLERLIFFWILRIVYLSVGR
jgi:hypothetical protein